MIKSQELMTLQRSTSTSSGISSRKMIVPVASNHMRSNSSTIPALAFTTTHDYNEISDRLLIPKHSPVSLHHLSKTHNKISSLLRSLLNLLSFPTLIPTCKWLRNTHLSITPTLGRKVTGTLFGNRRGHVNFAVQLDPCSPPLLLLELAMSTSSLVKEMSSGLVRIALESEKVPVSVPGKTTTTATATAVRGRKLFQEPAWTMYCNGRKCGLAVSRACVDFDWHVLSTIRSVSVGAGVIPVVDDGRKGAGSEGELLYMRARFERVVGSRDSEAFYMMNPDGNGGPELSIFLLRI